MATAKKTTQTLDRLEEWTEGRYNAFITSILRAGMRRWPNKWKALKRAEAGKFKGTSGRLAMFYSCAACKDMFPAKQVQVDHVDPVVDPQTGFVSWDVYIDRLFCSVERLQVLCLPCHKDKTKVEKAKRTTKKPTSTTRSKRSLK